MDVEMAYVQDSFLTNDVLQEMVSYLRAAAAPGSPFVVKLLIILPQLSQCRGDRPAPTTPDWVTILHSCVYSDVCHS